MTTHVLSVPGITCDHCKAAIEAKVGAVPGVTSVTVEVTTRQVTVEGSATQDALRAAIDQAGYEAAPA